MSLRGQAVVETSIAMIVATSIIVLGIELSEVMDIAVKAPMLAHALLFDATAHDFSRRDHHRPILAAAGFRLDRDEGQPLRTTPESCRATARSGCRVSTTPASVIACSIAAR